MIPLLVLLVATPPSPVPEDAVVAFVMVDRFADGAPNLPDVVPGHPRRFQGGDLAGLRARLPYLARLGVTHVWITPVVTQVGPVGRGNDATAAYHGYWPRDLAGVDPHFGTEDDLSALTAEARALGIGIILDVVVNHLGYGAPDPDRLVRGRCGDTDVDRCLFGLPDLATEDPRVRAVVIARTTRFATKHSLAGFRFDAFKHVEPEVFRVIREAVRAHDPAFFTFAEHWGAAPGDPDVARIVDSGAADAVLDFSFMGLARDWLLGRMRTAAFIHHLRARDAALRAGPPMLAFLDNHDVETWAFAVGERAPLGAPLLLFDRAIPVITWGTEVGRQGGAGDPDNRQFMPWDDVAAAELSADAPLHRWRRLVALRRAHPVMRAGTLEVLGADAGDEPTHLVLQRRDRAERVVTAIARGRALRHVQPLVPGERIVDVLTSAGGRVSSAQGRLVLDVPADGFVVVAFAQRDRLDRSDP